MFGWLLVAAIDGRAWDMRTMESLCRACKYARNYRFFFMFVFLTTLLCIYVFAFCWVYIRRIMALEEQQFELLGCVGLLCNLTNQDLSILFLM
ncbi:probable protein S-acyltransferase 1 [Cajanus cajan]|uniref:probable protein S-acyltransferase 1 n=1 Tax=Cajanus cajan TaxID=3821 RepID=UPI00098DC0EB|nr:probable protein S-acyltransferase 1 [Cajanus cajan]